MVERKPVMTAHHTELVICFLASRIRRSSRHCLARCYGLERAVRVPLDVSTPGTAIQEVKA